MIRNRKFVLLAAVAITLCAGFISARAQAPAAPVIKTRFEVLRMMNTGIQVRSLADQREIHTFLYSDKIRGRMQALFNSNSGYQYGDKVVIQYMRGSDIALDIRGKASKPS